jgi:Predicted membrane protein (DUF2207)
VFLPFVVATNSLVERWRDTGPVLWVGAGVALALWVAVLVVLAMQSEPRRVSAGSPTLDPGGPEPPAVVNLVTSDWELGRESVPATLLDLAARRFISIDWIGERTLIRVRERGPSEHDLTDYEDMVLDHVRSLSHETADGFVPADALTTGPDAMATRWWSRFQSGVIKDARARGLSRPRWSSGARTILTAMAVVVGLSVGVASTTLTSDKKDDDPIGAAAGLALMSTAVLVAIGSKLKGERDTGDGRVAAARWLGLRSMLADDPAFATQPPAAVTIWDRMMSYGAALGVARAAVATLPLGAESERHAWSPVGNRWRVVKIRYPRRVPPGYGRHPGLVALVGLGATIVGVLIGPGAVSVADSLLRSIDDVASNHSAPVGVRIGVGVVLAVVVTAGVLLAIYGAGMLIAGVADLVRPRRNIEGRVLRIRERGDEKHRFWHIAVDDGTSDHIRAWRVKAAPAAHQGAVIRARVSPWLGHVNGLSTIRTDDKVAAAPIAGAAVVPAGGAVAVAPPPLPDALAVSAAIGVPVSSAPAAVAHPLALDAASSTYLTQDGGRIIAAWIRSNEFDALRPTLAPLASTIAGVGEAYRSPIGGGVVARVDGHVMMILATLPAFSAEQRDRAVAAVAQLTAANASISR